MNKISVASAKIISVIFHPLLLPIYGLIILFTTEIYLSLLPYSVKKNLFLIIIVGLTTFPLSFIPLLVLRKVIPSLEMSSRKDRIYPMLIVLVFYTLTWVFVSRFQLSFIINRYLVSCVIMAAVLFVANFFWKISLHATGMGALFGLVIYFALFYKVDVTLYLTIVVIVSGLVSMARLYLGAHSSLQVYVGFILGFAILLSSFLVVI